MNDERTKYIELLDNSPFDCKEISAELGYADSSMISHFRYGRSKVNARDLDALRAALQRLKERKQAELRDFNPLANLVDNTPSVTPGDTHGASE